jgi:hypothetical protein
MNTIRFTDVKGQVLPLMYVRFGKLVKFPNSDAVYILSDMVDGEECLLVDIETGEHVYKHITVIPKVIYNAEIILTREAV